MYFSSPCIYRCHDIIMLGTIVFMFSVKGSLTVRLLYWLKYSSKLRQSGFPFSVSQFKHSVMSDSVTPWTAAHQASLPLTISQSLPKFMSIVSVMPSNHLILCCPLLLLPSIFPSIKVFPSTGEGNGKPLQHSCLENPMNSMKRLLILALI